MSKKNNTSKIDVEYLNQLKESVIGKIDKKIEEEKYNALLESVDSLSDARSFSIMTEMYDRLLDVPNATRLIGGIIRELKNNPTLRENYLLHERLTNPKYFVGITNTESYINEALSAKKNNKKADLKKYHGIIKECLSYVCENADEAKSIIDSTDTPINNAFTSLIESKSNVKNFYKRMTDKAVLAENIEKLKQDSELNETANVTVDQLTEEYENCTEAWKKDVLIDMITEEVVGGKNRKSLFEQCKSFCIEKIDGSLDNENKENTIRLSEMKEKLSKKEYCGNTYYEDMMLMAELKNTL